MSSYRQHLYHIVIRTKDKRPVLCYDKTDKLYAYFAGIIKNQDSHLYINNGVEDHIHILTDMHPSLAPANFVKDIKVSSSMWIKKSGLFPKFDSWSVGYGSFTCSYRDIDVLREYVKNQQKHHEKVTFEEEFRMLVMEAGIEFDEKYFP